jgi:sporulation protein YlmC with PRC-barrel domain
MKKNSLLVILTAAITAASAYAADVEVKAKADVPKVQADVKRDGDAARREYKEEVRVETAVKPVNRAHNLIGMEVRNKNDERLGEVKDLVIDLPTGKISYVALAVGGFLGVGEKLIAVPTSALTPSERSDKYMIMDATRGEIVDAPGFVQTNWPDYRNPNFSQSPYWRPKALGSAAGSESGKGTKIYTDAERKDRELKVEAKTK